MSEMSFEQASEALSSAAAQDAAEVAAPTPAAPATSTPAPDSSGSDAGTTATPDSFTSIDPNTLPPELQAAYKSMQGDYTRKSQEVAQLRSIQEQLGESFDPSRVTQSMEFVNALETDAEFAQAVYNQLNDVLTQAGILEGSTEPQPDASLGGVDPEFQDPESAMAQQIEELKQWKEQQEYAQREQALAAHIQRQDMALRQEHPDWQDSDYDAVYQLAFAHGGDLIAAGESYANLQQRLVESYINAKSAVPSGAQAVTSGGFASEPAAPVLDFEAAHKAAMEHIRNLG